MKFMTAYFTGFSRHIGGKNSNYKDTRFVFRKKGSTRVSNCLENDQNPPVVKKRINSRNRSTTNANAAARPSSRPRPTSVRASDPGGVWPVALPSSRDNSAGAVVVIASRKISPENRRRAHVPSVPRRRACRLSRYHAMHTYISYWTRDALTGRQKFSRRVREPAEKNTKLRGSWRVVTAYRSRRHDRAG